MRLLLDEHFSLRIARALRKRGRDVVCTLEAGVDHTEDAHLWRWAISQGRVLVSRDKDDFPRIYALFWEEGVHHPGLVLVAAKSVASADVGGMVRALEVLLREDPDLTDQLVFLRPVGGT